MNLGISQYLGVGCPVDHENGLRNALRASLAGDQDARNLYAQAQESHPASLFAHVEEGLPWPSLTFMLGATAPGHLDDLFNLTADEEKGGPKLDRLMDYERQSASLLFGNADLLGVAFGEPVKITKYLVARAHVAGEWCTSISIDMNDVQRPNGRRVWWRPSDEGLHAVAGMIGQLGGRRWVRFMIFTPIS
jgi:hypothetical protein